MRPFIDWLVADFSIFGLDVQAWTLFVAGILGIWIVGVALIVRQ